MLIDASLLSALRSFEAAGRLLNFTGAAGVLHVTQSAVSQQIRHLEDRLGFDLFVRRRHRLELTDRGAILHACAARVFADLEQTLTRLGPRSTTLQVNCLPSFALHWLMPRLVELQRLMPEIAIRLQAEFQSLDPISMRTGEIDVAIRYDPNAYADLQAVPALDEFLLPVATPAYLAGFPDFVAGRSIEGVVLLHDASPWDGAPRFIEWRTWLEARRRDWLGAVGGIEFNLASLCISAALNGQGVAMARTALVLDELLAGRLVRCLGAAVPAPARYTLLTRDRKDGATGIFSRWFLDECRRFDLKRNSILRSISDLEGEFSN